MTNPSDEAMKRAADLVTGLPMTRAKEHGGGDAGDKYAIYAATHRAFIAVGQNSEIGKLMQQYIMMQLGKDE